MNFSILNFDSLGSTSTKAMELAAAGQKSPFCVWAKTQTAGRGRRGKSWIGAPGNLFLTLVLPSKNNHFREKGLLPVAVATLLADWISCHFGVLARIKWPNDIFFGTEKLGGILCESSIQGTEWSDTFIGIGLNLNQVPAETLEYHACSIAGITGANSVDVESSVHALVSFFSKHWSDLSETRVLSSFLKKSIHLGLPWRQGEASRSVYLNGCLRPNGGMDFATAEGSGVYSLTSVHHDLSCPYFQSSAVAPFFVADVGNTAIKLKCYKTHECSDNPQSRIVANLNYTDDVVLEALKSISPTSWIRPVFWPFYIASVNRELGERLFALLKAADFYPVAVEKKPVYRREDSRYLLEDLGIDRLALIEAWLKSRRSVRGEFKSTLGILVSAGSATTIDVVESSGCHVMGEILPGLQMALTALNLQTSLLPLIDLSKCDSISAPGISTVTAMMRGALDMTVGAIKRCIDAYLTIDSHANTDIDLVLTGGYARLLADELGVDESKIAVTCGIRILVLGA